MDLLETLKNRYSCRKYKENPPNRDVIEKILEAARIAPSAANKQPYRLIVVTAPTTRKALFAAYERDWFCAAPVIIVACGLPAESYRRAWDGQKYTWVDIGIALDHVTLAATAMGLATCWIGAFKKEIVKDVLGIPEEVEVVAMMSLGFPDDANPRRPRKDLSQLLLWEKWKLE